MSGRIDDICGVILAGGRARRMMPDRPQGGDKALVYLGGEPLIGHVIRRLAPQVSHLIINANGDAARFEAFGLPVIADAVEDRGPLSGVLAAMDWASAHAPTCAAVLSVSTDTPFLPKDLAQALSAGTQGQTANTSAIAPAIAMSAGRLHPVIGLWPVTLREALQRTLDEGRFSVERFAQSVQAIAVPFTLRTIGPVTLDPFFNANTPGELAEAEAFAAHLKETEP
jgi:molybdopterin-guanine dinucleotide biosynthesis protein A